MQPLHALAALIVACAALSGCAAMEPAETGASATKLQPGSFKVRMNGELRAYGTVSSKPH